MNEEETMLIAKAISEAREAYNKVFENEGIDAAYYPLLKMVVGECVNNDFSNLIETVEFKDYSGNGISVNEVLKK